MKSIYLLGATSSGKHSAAMKVAGELGAEIISIDSVKVYRGMDIGSAKPSPAQRKQVVHHLIDICAPSEVYSAARFVDDARAAEEDVRSRGRRALFVGGTALYYKAYMYGLFRGPGTDPVIRDELVAVAKERGTSFLHEELHRVDPEAATRIHPNDLRRLVRALEVYRKTGEPITSFQTQFAEPDREGIVVWIDRSRDDLKERLTRRTRDMFERGLEAEVKALLQGAWGKEGRNAVGYREVIDMLEGRCTREEAESAINRRTHRFVRRQRTWFRSFPEAKPVSTAPDEDPTDRILKEITG